jgi:hypothetical protein
MFDETVSPDVRDSFEDILSEYSVFMAQQGTPTVREFCFSFIYIVFRLFKYGESLTASKKAEVIGQNEMAAEKEMPYDTTKTTGKIAATLLTGLIVV